jgi:hypothetical protein
MIEWFLSLIKKNNYPISGKDAQWLANCSHCNDMELFVSRSGLKNGGIEHCNRCGLERLTNGFKQTDINRMLVSSKIHWFKYPKFPYNWHELTEDQHWEILGGK